jgi:uncharacterized membrane protein (UPF0136 family)
MPRDHPAFSYAVLVSLAGGTGYVLKRHLPSLVGGTALGIGFLGAGMLVMTDTITNYQFNHGTSAAMSTLIASVMGNHAIKTKFKIPAIISAAGVVSSGYHSQRLLNEPSKVTYADFKEKKRKQVEEILYTK